MNILIFGPPFGPQVITWFPIGGLVAYNCHKNCTYTYDRGHELTENVLNFVQLIIRMLKPNK